MFSPVVDDGVPSIVRAAVTVEQSWHAVPGGTATSVLHTLRALAGRDDVDVVGVAARHAARAPEPFVPPVPVTHLPLPRRALYEAWHAVRWPPVQLATGPVDIVHATTAAIPPRSSPLVVTVHDLAFLHAPEHFTRNGNRFFRRGLTLARRHADLVLVPSQATADDCERVGIGADRIRLVPHGVEALPVTADDVVDVRRRHGLARPYVLWCGTLEPRKNLPTLLAAFARLAVDKPDLDLVLAGPSGWGDAGTGHHLPVGRVHALGFVDESDLHALYAGARAFCYPSLREGFGMPVLEALAHGVPVVTSAGTPMAELVGHGGLVVPATDTEALADALIATTGVQHDSLAAGARPAAGGYTWERAADLTVAAYREVTGR